MGGHSLKMGKKHLTLNRSPQGFSNWLGPNLEHNSWTTISFFPRPLQYSRVSFKCKELPQDWRFMLAFPYDDFDLDSCDLPLTIP